MFPFPGKDNFYFTIGKAVISNDSKFEFHIAKSVRKKYEFNDELFSITGNVIFANLAASRSFAHKLNSKRDKNEHVNPGEVNAMGLLDEIYHYILRRYETEVNPGVFDRCLKTIHQNLGEDFVQKLIYEFVNLFPPMDVYKGRISILDYLNSYSGSKSNAEIALEELMLLYFANFNPANSRLKELFNDNYFSHKENYGKVIQQLDIFFQNEKPFGPENQPIFELLKTPILKNPNNLWDQLLFVREKWSAILEPEFLLRLLTSQDLMKEDFKLDTFFGGGGGSDVPTVAPKYKGKMDEAEFLILGKSLFKYAADIEKDYEEPEQFTPDIHWMPNVILIAKNVYVWLDQLSKKYKREIKTLDQIPDEELDQLARWHINSLWFIGIWERSSASQKIKHMMGNVDAVSSAYSLFDYEIANDLGGDAAYERLNERAKLRGIRLASDMVPNHTGIFSRWIIEHPEYFIQADNPPFPNYTFTGENLSQVPDIELRIEDGYWRKTDAAVVFQRIDKRNGDVKYIYHGNDGTNMPWNDTAQLDLLKREVREAVIQEIFGVAKKFSIIRFDAAMTLTKRHFSRLWYPQPGKGGDIPSRADCALPHDDFDRLFPEEFWREVVDRFNYEMPETLLLAEAFWLMEGYFVRSLGMHRVYNSAFMHMMMKEENAKYRDLITNTLEFEPEILKRYVNFMSNPDEETAIKQYGTDDKYFGVLLMMITLPGLPMFAHGQIEGYTEKYGMEYKRAYYNETPKFWLIERHERDIFPLMRRRYLFAEVVNFWIYECIDDYGTVNENVFAFTNSFREEKALVVYNNRFDRAYGKIRLSSPKLVNKELRRISLAEALGIKDENKLFYIYRDRISHLEFLLRGSDFVEKGYQIDLEGFKYHVYLGFKEIYDSTREYEQLYYQLNGSGVYNIEKALEEFRLQPLHEAFEGIYTEKNIESLVNSLISEINEDEIDEGIKITANKYYYLLNQLKSRYSISATSKTNRDKLVLDLKNIAIANEVIVNKFPAEQNITNRKLNHSIVFTVEASYTENMLVILLWMSLSRLSEFFIEEGEINKDNYYEKLQLAKPLNNILKILGRGEEGIYREVSLLNILLEFGDKLFDIEVGPKDLMLVKDEEGLKKFLSKHKSELISSLLEDDYVKAFLGINFYEDIWYYSKERFEELIDWLFSVSIINFTSGFAAKQKVNEAEPVEKVMVGIKEEKLESEKVASPELELDEQLGNFIQKMFMLSNYLKKCSDKAEYKLDHLKLNLLVV
ncbi:MAG: alpha-amylase family glycosyl hydrolase [bacterium]